VTKRISTLGRADIQFALDDFGTGYSSMSYLTNYYVDFLRIAQSFVNRGNENEAREAIRKTMIIHADKLGLKIIAEDVEGEERP
jgi:EAL domain-containing protein (putative c-di-GMP-specific phosphodiesterase class I)